MQIGENAPSSMYLRRLKGVELQLVPRYQHPQCKRWRSDPSYVASHQVQKTKFGLLGVQEVITIGALYLRKVDINAERVDVL